MLQQILAHRKLFIHRPLEILNTDILEQVNTDAGRFYKTPTGDLYPSVTTVTGLMGLEGIKAWRKKVGEEAANAISSGAAVRGTRIHQLCEDYLNNNEIDASKYSYQDAVNFKEFMPLLNDHLNNIIVQETRLYSDYLRMAGTVDCVAEWKGKLAIIDFKTARKHKNRDYITNYFCQAAAYAIMFEERYAIPISRLVILISVDDDVPQVFEERRDVFVKQLLDVRQQYKDKHGI